MSKLRVWHHDPATVNTRLDTGLLMSKPHYFDCFDIPAWPTKFVASHYFGQRGSGFIEVNSEVDVLLDVAIDPDADHDRARMVSAGQSVWFQVDARDKMSFRAASNANAIIDSVTDSAISPNLSEITIPAPGVGMYNEIVSIQPTISGTTIAIKNAAVQILQDATDLIYEAIVDVPLAPSVAAPLFSSINIAVEENLSALVRIVSGVTIPSNTLNVGYLVKSIRKGR